MGDTHFLQNIVIIFGTAFVVARMLRVLRAPSILGFLLTGIVIGPPGLGLIEQSGVESLAEIGLVLLLFIVGIELSPAPFLKMGRNLLIASSVQIVTTVLLATLILLPITGWPLLSVLIVGVAVSLSSTAIVLKQLSDRGETDTLSGQITTGILLVQDVFVVLLMLILPVFAQSGGTNAWTSGLRLFAALGAVVVAAVFSRTLLPLFLERVVRTGGRELVTLFAVVVAVGGAWLAGAAGWSLPLGACIAGMILAEADERHQIAADILPFRDVFNALFFISLGMLVDLDLAMAHWALLGAAIVATLFAKTIITTVAVRMGRWPIRPALQVAVGLCTVSEFGFVLAREADKLGLLEDGLLDMLVVYALGTMAAGSFLGPLAEPIASRLSAWFQPESAPEDREDPVASDHERHVIIIGYGVNGHNLARVLKSTRIQYTVIEMNPGFVAEARADGAKVIVGDAVRYVILEHAGLAHAHALVIAINDPQATFSIVSRAREARPDLYILARTRYVVDLERMYRAGADLVIPEEFETSIEIAAHVLKEMNIPDNIVDGQLAAVRAGRYGMLRGMPTTRTTADELMKVFQTSATRTHYLAEESFPCGKTLAELNLRAITGASVIAVIRGGKPTTNPPPDFRFEAADVLILFGAHIQLESAKAVLERTS